MLRGPRRASRAVAAGRTAATAATEVVGKEAATEGVETAVRWVAERVAVGREVATGAAMAAEGWEAARGVAARGVAARVEEAKEVAAAEGVVAVEFEDRQVARLADTMVAGQMVVASGEGVRVEAAEAEGELVEGAKAGVSTVVAIRVAETALELATGGRATATAAWGAAARARAAREQHA